MAVAARSVLLSAGSNSGGQLGLGHAVDAHTLESSQCDQGAFPPGGYTIQQLSGGSNHCVAILRPSVGNSDKNNLVESQLWVSGNGESGQLGKRMMSSTVFRRLDMQLDLDLSGILPAEKIGENDSQWYPVQVACGWNWTFIVLRNSDSRTSDALVVLGRDNDFGQLGIGQSKLNESVVSRVKLHEARQGHGLGSLRISGVTCGLRHTLVRCEWKKECKGHRVMIQGWGAARHGQLDCEALDKATAVYWNARVVDEWQCDQIEASQSILSAGKEHSIYYRDDTSTLRMIGSNRQGQRDVSRVVKDRVLLAACTWNATLALQKEVGTSKQTVVGSGNNTRGQLGSPEKQHDGIVMARFATEALPGRGELMVRSLVCGSEHVMILLDSYNTKSTSTGQVWGWGWNEHGNLAQNDEEDRREPVQIWPSTSDTLSKTSSRATDVWAGCGTTFIQITADPYT
ncbi:hypothetical protein CBS101457_003258 [Exobasidium rhododendri]|nr:hypothetical protein CBS101457_003258 [Exobasidium rhododendri]